MTSQPPEQPSPYGGPPTPGQPSPYQQPPGQLPYPPPASGPPPYPAPRYGQPYYGGPPPQQRTTNGFAITSMVLGILWIWWIGSILALIFGYIARKQIRQNNQSGDGMAIAGIVLGWIGVGIFAVVVLLAVVGASSGSSGGY
jgi:Domain of unknown function (DUF4190)